MSSIFITTPALSPHGGIRIILEWANRLAARGHTVYLRPLKDTKCEWFQIDTRVRTVYNDEHLPACDVLLITSPHAIHYATFSGPKRKFLFLQMMEHRFHPKNKAWHRMCELMYRSEHPLISISRWNIEELKTTFKRHGPIYYIGNGVNLDHFPISTKPKDGKTVLVEGWMPGNATKDTDNIAPKAASMLRGSGWRIVAYGQAPLAGAFRDIPHEYHQVPSLIKLNQLYEDATILLKASHCDARSCSPMEAMTKGTVTARAIDYGDDDLIHGLNCLRCDYNAEDLYQNAKILLQEDNLRNRLARACIDYVQFSSWDRWMEIIEGLLWPKS